jgi:chromosome segregation protein
MRLRTLRLHGFKSFADRTQLEFRDGITAVVGSNGCGKSNIADAIRWVLGEQRASAIRGAKMDEVIFQGTTRRRPLNFAEVALLFSNEDGRIAVPQTEIEIARKTFREGGSEYSLNRTACRLRDIHNLLRDTGLGSNAYSIIEAGMIETLLSDRAEERRSLFEEAAGIGRYKDSRQATMRRLEGAEADLARLGDLVAEVESKVRSLARQRRRAQRLQELQARRLDLEVAMARRELAQLEQALQAHRQRMAELERVGAAARAERAASEAALDRHRSEQVELNRRRATVGVRLDEIRNRLHLRERETALADERRSNAEMRIAQLVRERAEQESRRTNLEAEAEQLAVMSGAALDALEAARARLALVTEAGGEIRGVVAAERQRSEAGVTRIRQLARDVAEAEGERASLQRRRQEAASQAEQQLLRLDALGGEAQQLGAEAEAWAARASALGNRLEAAAEAVEASREELRLHRTREVTLRDALRRAEDRLSELAAQVEARDALERSYEGFAPAVAAIMAARDRFPGVHGPLADFVDAGEAQPGASGAVEAFLGPLLHAVVVEDLATARDLRNWFRSEWKGGGALLLLPLDAASLARHAATPSTSGWTGSGGGARWTDALLAELVVVEDDPLAESEPGRSRSGPGGDIVDARGIVRLVEQGEGEGILARRARLAALRSQLHQALSERDRCRADRDALADVIVEAEDRAREAEEVRRVTGAELQRVQGEAEAHSHRCDRAQREHAELQQQLARQEAVVRETQARLLELEDRLAALRASLAEAEAEGAAVRDRLAALEGRWESVRDEEAEHRVTVARAEAERRDLERRLGGARQGAEAARARLAAIDGEAAELRRTLEAVAGVRERAGEELQQLFASRDLEAAALQNLDARLAELESAITAMGEQARRARRREESAAEEKHGLELQAAEARSRSERLAERLEAEWGRPWEALLASANPVEAADPERWRTEIRETAAQIDAIGPVNMLAVQEHEEEARRLEFLLAQQKDLVGARDDLVAAIRQINRTARELFLATFTAIRENFQRTFHSLFQGGECDVWLADESDPLESAIEIQASPRGKKTQRIHLLSGGERTLTALALLFAIYLVKPSPFCLLDEVDAPLDESNVGRFLQLLQDFKKETQFVVITHNTRTMEAADWVYGVTMEEPGVSAIVGVELEGAWAREGRVA